MRFLRTASTRRLLAAIAGLVLAILGGTAIALAAAGGGPTPAPQPLAQAVHSALAAPAITGITARISFTNHVIDASNLQGSDPILTGATGRLWLSPSAHRLRLELQSDNGDAQLVVNNGAFWVYDPSSNTVYRGTLPAQQHSASDATQGTIPTVAEIQAHINQFLAHANLSGAQPSDVAGRPTYTVSVSPKHDGGLLGSAQLAWDAIRGIPLRFAVYARGNGSPVLELKVTNISYGKVPAGDFNVSPPKGAKVVTVSQPAANSAADAARARAHGHGKQQEITGTAAVARQLNFNLVAPDKLVGLPRQSVSLIESSGTKGALVSYGQNLGGILVIEQKADTTSRQPAQPSSGDRRGLSLPTVSINGATGQELDTALGTVVRFTRGGVTYTVLGSVPAAAADAAARAL